MLIPTASGGWGFAAALTNTGKAFTRAESFHDFIMSMGNNGCEP